MKLKNKLNNIKVFIELDFLKQSPRLQTKMVRNGAQLINHILILEKM